MLYLSIDIETGGLNPEQDSLLEFAAILEDTNNLKSFDEIPKFQTYIINDKIIGNPFALNMNKGIIEKLANYPKNEKEYNFTNYENLSEKFYNWLLDIKYDNIFLNENQYIYSYGERYINSMNINVAGKNFLTLDYKFLEKVPKFTYLFKINKAILDPAILYIDWNKDNYLPNTKKCNDIANVINNNLHSALSDAWNVVQLLRKKY